MKRYGVTLPIAGHAYVEVEADTKADALALAHASWTDDDINELDSYTHLSTGNVLHVSPGSADVEELEDE